MKTKFKQKIWVFLSALFLISASGKLWSLDAGNYTIILSKVNSDGTVTDLSQTTGSPNSSGVLTFSFTTGVPTVTDNNFIVLTIKNSEGTVVRKSLVPAPADTSTTNSAGLNGLSNAQSQALLNAAADAQTDDPFYTLFGFMMLRSSTLSEADRNLIASGGRAVILGSGGVKEALLTRVSASQYNTFVKKIVSNTTSGTKDLADYCSNFKDAVDNNNADLTAKAGGFLADVVIDAADAAGFDVGYVTESMETAGKLADSNADFAKVSTAANLMMDQAINNFFKRLRSMKVKKEYGLAFSALNASGTQVTRFNSAVDTLVTCFEGLETQYRDNFENQNIDAAKQQEMNTAFSNCFSTFQTNILSTDAEVLTVKTACAQAMSVNVNQMPADFGKNYNFSGSQVNQSIPANVLDNFICSTVTGGGSLIYTRHALSIPQFMQGWLGVKTDFDTTLNGLSATFIDLQKLKEDIEIIQASMWNSFIGGTIPTFDQMIAAKQLMQTRLDDTVGRISGTTNGTTAFSTAQKKGMIKMVLEPDIH